MTFIFLLICINIILFLPRYLAGLPRKWNPFDFILIRESLSKKFKALYFSRIIDPFRLSFEYTFVALLLSQFPNNKLAILTVSAFAFVHFVFNCYVAVFLNTLNRTPILKSDWIFTKENIGFYKGYYTAIVIGFIVLTLTIYILLFQINTSLFNYNLNFQHALIALSVLIIISFYNTKPYTITDYLSRTIISITIYCFKSKKQTDKYANLFKLSAEHIQNKNPYSKLKLKNKPNIHVISFESYGSILLKEKEYYAEEISLLNKWQSKFASAGVHCYSTMAKPPYFASGTSYSMSTLLYGMRIADSYTLNILFNELKKFSEYISLFRFTKKNGYTNFLLNGLIGDFDNTVNFKLLENKLTYDIMLRNDLLEYEGQQLSFMNMQKCIPDQYTLNKGIKIAQEAGSPYTLFYCTLNSHFNFDSPLKKEEDWKKINNKNYVFETTKDQNWDKYRKYKQTINYTIDSLFDTIIKNIKEDDIYIIYGDHQPTLIAEEKHGIETPIHIISLNNDFIKLWQKYGFIEGIIPEESQDPIKFEAIYSVFMKNLNIIYGKDKDLNLPFMKDGVKLV